MFDIYRKGTIALLQNVILFNETVTLTSYGNTEGSPAGVYQFSSIQLSDSSILTLIGTPNNSSAFVELHGTDIALVGRSIIRVQWGALINITGDISVAEGATITSNGLGYIATTGESAGLGASLQGGGGAHGGMQFCCLINNNHLTTHCRSWRKQCHFDRWS